MAEQIHTLGLTTFADRDWLSANAGDYSLWTRESGDPIEDLKRAFRRIYDADIF